MQYGFRSLLLLSVLFLSSGCRESFVVGIVPVYTEESRDQPELTVRERINIEQGYREGLRRSRKYSKVVFPLYLACRRYKDRYYDCRKALNPKKGWREYVRTFYAEYYFSRRRSIQQFMHMNGINLLIASHFFWNRQRNEYEIELSVFRIVPGSKESVSMRSTRYWVPGFQDYQRLRLMSEDALTRILDRIDTANP